MLKKTMSVKLYIIILVLIFVMVISGVIGYCNGENSSANKSSVEYSELVTFYATIIDVDENYFHVAGLDINDINSRGEFTFMVNDETPLLWRGTDMDLSEFKAGQTIAITYTGDVLETAPAQILEVLKIGLLDDEK